MSIIYAHRGSRKRGEKQNIYTKSLVLMRQTEICKLWHVVRLSYQLLPVASSECTNSSQLDFELKNPHRDLSLLIQFKKSSEKNMSSSEHVLALPRQENVKCCITKSAKRWLCPQLSISGLAEGACRRLPEPAAAANRKYLIFWTVEKFKN